MWFLTFDKSCRGQGCCVHCHPQSACLEQKGCSWRWFCVLRFWLWLWQLPCLAGTAGCRGKADQSSGGGWCSLPSTAQSRATHRSLLPSDNWARISTFRSAWIQRKEPCVAANCIQTFHKYKQLFLFWFGLGFFVKNRFCLRRNSKSHLGGLSVPFPCNANLLPALFGGTGRTVSLTLCSLGLSDSRNSQICHGKTMSSSLVFRMQLHEVSNSELLRSCEGVCYGTVFWLGEHICVFDYQMHLLWFAFLTPVWFKVTVKLVLVWNGLGTDTWQAILLKEN